MGGIGGPEIFVIFLVVLLVFGPKKIPEVARGLGKGLREIRRLTTEFQREINLSADEEEDPARQIHAGRKPGPPDPTPSPTPAGDARPRGEGEAASPGAASPSGDAPAAPEPPDGSPGPEDRSRPD